jgi:hypothetical protein
MLTCKCQLVLGFKLGHSQSIHLQGSLTSPQGSLVSPQGSLPDLKSKYPSKDVIVSLMTGLLTRFNPERVGSHSLTPTLLSHALVCWGCGSRWKTGRYSVYLLSYTHSLFTGVDTLTGQPFLISFVFPSIKWYETTSTKKVRPRRLFEQPLGHTFLVEVSKYWSHRGQTVKQWHPLIFFFSVFCAVLIVKTHSTSKMLPAPEYHLSFSTVCSDILGFLF